MSLPPTPPRLNVQWPVWPTTPLTVTWRTPVQPPVPYTLQARVECPTCDDAYWLTIATPELHQPHPVVRECAKCLAARVAEEERAALAARPWWRRLLDCLRSKP